LTLPTLLARDADIVVTMDDGRREIHDAGLFVRDGIIEQVGPSAELPQEADVVLDMTGQILLPASSTPTTTSTRR
jgi:cytosine/adenosine deaminase-related metal-dependent hydrolase